MFRVIILGTIPYPGEMLGGNGFIPATWVLWKEVVAACSAPPFSPIPGPTRSQIAISPAGWPQPGDPGENLSVHLAVFLCFLHTWGSGPDGSWIWKLIRGFILCSYFSFHLHPDLPRDRQIVWLPLPFHPKREVLLFHWQGNGVYGKQVCYTSPPFLFFLLYYLTCLFTNSGHAGAGSVHERNIWRVGVTCIISQDTFYIPKRTRT